MSSRVQFIERLVKLGYCSNINGDIYIQFNKVHFPNDMWLNTDKSFCKSVGAWISIQWKCLLDSKSRDSNLIIWKSSVYGSNSPWGRGEPVNDNMPYDLENIVKLK